MQNRQDFTKGMIDTLTSGADLLVVADSNEEGANLLALQTRSAAAQTTLVHGLPGRPGRAALF